MTKQTNLSLAKSLFHALKKMNVKDFVVCAGARNIPLVHQLEKSDFNIYSYFEERSAAFFSLGRIRATERPVAIVTTSGTAVAELLPAVIEAYYQNLPLIVISADRPKGYRGSGAPQAIYQPGLFSCYAEKVYDWDIHQQDLSIEVSLSKPVHFNICFDEPLIDSFFEEQRLIEPDVQIIESRALSELKQNESKQQWDNPLLLLCDIPQQYRETVKKNILQHQLIHYAEVLSSLKNDSDLLSCQIQTLDLIAADLEQFGFSSIVRVGGVPTHRIWRDLEKKYEHIPVLNITHREFSGLSRKTETQHFDKFNSINFKYTNSFNRDLILDKNAFFLTKKNQILEKLPESEINFIKMLSEVIDQQPLYLGNSLPIREWDLASEVSQKDQKVFAHRGANGIDGQISGYLGWSKDMSYPSWCVVGDLTALYDLASLGMADKTQKGQRIVIINNSGGKIFNRIFGNKKYLNSQDVDFSGWAKLWNWNYQLIKKKSDMHLLSQLSMENIIIEIQPNEHQSEQFWQDWDKT